MSAPAVASPDWHGDPRLPCRATLTAGGRDLWFSHDRREREQAHWLCQQRCPRLAECAAQAEADNERHGVWGGVSRDEPEHRAARARPSRLTPEVVARRALRAAVRREQVIAAYHALAPRGLLAVEAAAELGVGVSTLRRALREGRAAGDPRAVLHSEHGARMSPVLRARAAG